MIWGMNKLTKHRPRVQIRAQELAIAAETGFRSETLHVRHFHETGQEVSQTLAVLELGVDVDFVLPFELGPHGPELGLSAVCGLDVVHNVDVDVVEDHDLRVRAVRAVVDDVAEDDAGVGRGDFDGGFGEYRAFG
jgi:hypothetical protein